MNTPGTSRRRHRRRLHALILAALAGMGLAVASAAGACVPQPLVTLQPRAFGPAGSEVTINVISVSDNASDEVRWNGVDGPVLAKASGSSFSVTATIPPVPDGLYAVVALERKPDGSVGVTGRAGFLVSSTGASIPTAPHAQTVPRAAPTRRSSTGSAVAVVAGGVGLLAVGAVGGTVIARRRRVSDRRAPEGKKGNGGDLQE